MAWGYDLPIKGADEGAVQFESVIVTTANGNDRPLVFVSYSHRDREAKEFVERHLRVLRMAGSIEVWHDGEIGIGDDWYQVIEAKLKCCAVAVLLISTDFLGSEFCIKREVPVLLERRKREGMLITPILLRPCAWKIFPWLAAIQMLPKENMPLLGLELLKQEEELTKVVLAIHEFLQESDALFARAKELARTSAGQSITVQGESNAIVQISGSGNTVTILAGAKRDTPWSALPENAVDLSRLPTSGYDVVGRDDELRMLDEAFAGETMNVVALVGWGGVGKSTLVNKWCEYLAADNFRGAQRVFAWSFYSQGSNEFIDSADAFINEALRFFGLAEPLSRLRK